MYSKDTAFAALLKVLYIFLSVSSRDLVTLFLFPMAAAPFPLLPSSLLRKERSSPPSDFVLMILMISGEREERERGGNRVWVE